MVDGDKFIFGYLSYGFCYVIGVCGGIVVVFVFDSCVVDIFVGLGLVVFVVGDVVVIGVDVLYFVELFLVLCVFLVFGDLVDLEIMFGFWDDWFMFVVCDVFMMQEWIIMLCFDCVGIWFYGDVLLE